MPGREGWAAIALFLKAAALSIILRVIKIQAEIWLAHCG